MRICVVGKFPPIQGGVSTRTYWSAHDLAARGHEVHVVTNAKEARPPFRMHMRRQDWKRCEAAHSASQPGGASPGSVTVHWTDPVDSSQFYIPMASPFVSKLAATAARSRSTLAAAFASRLVPSRNSQSISPARAVTSVHRRRQRAAQRKCQLQKHTQSS